MGLYAEMGILIFHSLSPPLSTFSLFYCVLTFLVFTTENGGMGEEMEKAQKLKGMFTWSSPVFKLL